MSREPVRERTWVAYAAVLLMDALITALGREFTVDFKRMAIALLYLVPVLVSAARWRRGPSLLAAVLGVLAFALWFAPPILNDSVASRRYLITFAIFIAVAIALVRWIVRIRRQQQAAAQREELARDLLSGGSELAAASDLRAVYGVITALAHRFAGGPCVLFAAGDNDTWQPLAAAPEDVSGRLDAGHWRELRQTQTQAGDDMSVQRAPDAFYAALGAPGGRALVLYAGHSLDGRADEGVRARLQGLAELARAAVSHKQLEEAALKSELASESERLRTILLDSISHELRTPLATIIGSATSLIDGAELLTGADRQDLLLTIREGARRMNRLVTNLLCMVRLEAGMMTLRRRWCDVSDIIGVALAQVSDTFGQRDVQVDLPSELPTIAVDDILIEQALVNVLSNAAKYSAAGSTVQIRVEANDEFVTVSVADAGIGIRRDEAQRIFDKFYRSPTVAHIPGTGLGLAISKGVMDAHGGRICAEARRTGGTAVTLHIPIRGVDDRPQPALVAGGRREDA